VLAPPPARWRAGRKGAGGRPPVLLDFYDFDWTWEVFTPEHKRRWGYDVLQVFFRDRFVGRIEPRRGSHRESPP
jgi:hypothetical protein